MAVGWTNYTCGVEALHAQGCDVATIAAAVAVRADRLDAGFGLVFSSDEAIDADGLAAQLQRTAPTTEFTGCSTAGEMTADGIGEGSTLVMLFPRAHFAVSTLSIERIGRAGMSEIVDAVATLRRRHEAAQPGSGDRTFAICLIDGMSYAEEKLTSAIFWGLDHIPLVGGSAGDRLAFVETRVIANGSAKPDRAVVVLMTTDVPYHIFKSDNFIPVDTKFVVTASDPDRRIVHEFNAIPAAQEYAAALGGGVSMTQMDFASHPVIVRVGGEHYCRAIRSAEEDGSLVFYCAIDDGVVLTLAEARGMVESTRQTLQDVEASMGPIAMVLGFDCVYRRMDALNRQVLRKMSDLYKDYRVVGFGTYGEQYQSMHLNQTLIGIAFGDAPSLVRRVAAE